MSTRAPDRGNDANAATTVPPSRQPVAGHGAAPGQGPSGARAVALLSALALASAWAIYLPLGSKYLGYLSSALLAVVVVWQQRRWPELRRWPPMLAPMALWLMLVISATWSSAPGSDVLSHCWHYGRMLLMPVISLALPPEVARRGLRHFVCASVLVAVLTAIERLQLLPWLPLRDFLSSSADANGHQRIVTSLLLALGAAIALVQAGIAGQDRHLRIAWLVAAVVVAIGLSLQDRRTGMVALPLLLAALALTRQRSWWRAALLLGGVLALAALTWQFSSSVRDRFTEGLGELKAYQSTGAVDTSWGMRARLVDLTLEMVRDKPLLGHGLASWVSLWRQRAKGGGALLEAHTSPHSEVLLIATQAGAVGIVLWIAMLCTYLRQAWRAGRAGEASLLVWTAIAWSALFTSAIRDAKFALPLLMLAGLALAASRSTSIGAQGQSSALRLSAGGR